MRISCHLIAILLNLGATRKYPELRGFAPFVIDIYHVHVRSKHLKSECLLYWKYSKLLCIRTLITCIMSSVEAVHSQVIFFCYGNIQLFISFLLNFYFTFWFVIVLAIKLLKFWQLSFESFLPLGTVLVRENPWNVLDS